MMGIKLASAVFRNDACNQFFIAMYNRKTLGKVISIFQRLF